MMDKNTLLPPATLLSELLASSPTGMLILAADGRLSWANETLADMLGCTTQELIGKTQDRFEPAWARGLFERTEFIRVPPSGESPPQWLYCRYRPASDNHGWLGHVLDFTDIKALVEERDALRARVEELDTVDAVTGLPNEKGVLQYLEHQVSRSRRYQNPLSVVLLRLESLAGKADAAGAKEALLPISRLLHEQLRWVDFVGRLELGEFLLVLPETGEEDAHRLADKLGEQVRALPEAGSAGAAQFAVTAWRKGDDVRLLLRRVREGLARPD